MGWCVLFTGRSGVSGVCGFMIEFDCPHCGNHLLHQEAFAGRDGWCRICKGIISIPQPGQPSPVINLNLEQRYARLERLFKHAVSIVDEHRQLQARLQEGGNGLAEEVRLRTEAQQTSVSLNLQLEAATTSLHSVEAECETLRERVTALESDRDALQEQLDAQVLERSTLEVTLAEVQPLADRVPELEESLTEARDEIGRREHENDELLERVLDVEQKLETAGEMAEQAIVERAAERDAYEKRLDGLRGELCASEDESAALKEQLATAAAEESRLTLELEETQEAMATESERFETEIDRLTELHEAEITLREDVAEELARALPIADRVPVLEEELASARADINAGEARHDVLLQQVADTECALDLAGERAREARVAWESSRQQLLDEIESFRTGQRAAEEETAAVRAKAREAAAELQAQLDTMQADLLNETRLRIASDESERRLERRIAEANSARDDALSRRDQVSRQLEAKIEEYEAVRAEAASLRTRVSESEALGHTMQLRLTEARTERDNAIESREKLASKLNDATGSLESAQRVSAQLRSRITELEHTIAARDESLTKANAQPTDIEIAALNAEVEHLHNKVADLEQALSASAREKSRLEQRLVGAENRAAFSELEGVGYRSKFSSMAKQFFEQEVARQSDAHALPLFDEAEVIDPDREGANILDAVTQLRP